MNSSDAPLTANALGAVVPAGVGPRKRNSLISTSPGNGPVTKVFAVAELVDGSGSGVSDVAVAVLLIVVPRGVSLLTDTTNVRLAPLKAVIVPKLAVTVVPSSPAVP